MCHVRYMKCIFQLQYTRAALVSGYKDTEEFIGALLPWVLVSSYKDTRQKSSVGRGKGSNDHGVDMPP